MLKNAAATIIDITDRYAMPVVSPEESILTREINELCNSILNNYSELSESAPQDSDVEIVIVQVLSIGHYLIERKFQPIPLGDSIVSDQVHRYCSDKVVLEYVRLCMRLINIPIEFYQKLNVHSTDNGTYKFFGDDFDLADEFSSLLREASQIILSEDKYSFNDYNDIIPEELCFNNITLNGE